MILKYVSQHELLQQQYFFIPVQFHILLEDHKTFMISSFNIFRNLYDILDCTLGMWQF